MKLKYGIKTNCIDITSVCFEQLYSNGVITIPAKNENCDAIFGDPIFGIKKKIFKTDDDDTILEEFDDLHPIKVYVQEISNIIDQIYNSMTINYGKMETEKKMHIVCANNLLGNEKILEIGGNIGRTSLLIAYILNKYNVDNNLNNQLNLVTMECDINIANKLEENRNNNNFNFYIEKSALSNKEICETNNTITYDQLKNKYSINFDTLIIDCDGTFYNILYDIPEILDGIKLIIMKNDYDTLNKKIYIDNKLLQYNFETIFSQRGGWGACCNNFYEVWKKK